MNDLVSIIIPTHNDALRIEHCLNSAINQTYPYIEIVVVNDGSTDETSKILNQYIASYSNLHVINQKNSGTYVARLVGIKQSVGKYIVTLDSDDYLATDAIENLIDSALHSDADIVVGNYYQHRNGGKRIIRNQIPPIATEISTLKYLLLGKLHVHIWGRLFKREVLDSLGYFVKGVYSEDVLFNFSIFASNNWTLAYSDHPIVHHVIHDSNISRSRSPEVVEAFFKEFEIVESLLEYHGYKDCLKKELAFYRCNLWLSYCRKGGKLVSDGSFHRPYFKSNYPLATEFMDSWMKLELFAFYANPRFGMLVSEAGRRIKKLLKY